MKIIYYIPHDKNADDGVTKKISSQIKAWEDSGAEVLSIWHSNCNDEIASKHINVKFNRISFAKEIRHSIKQFKPDIVYLRYSSLNSLLIFLLLNFYCVFEVNGIAHTEKKLSGILDFKQAVKNIFHYMSLMYIKIFTKHFFTPTYELGKILNLKSFTILPNSIDVQQFDKIKSENISQRIQLFFMGTGNYRWHGLHYIKRMSELLPEYDFHIVGTKGVNKKNLFYYGYLSRSDYQNILVKIDICIGTLALHERGLSEASPLKVREYIAMGFPILINYKEDDNILEKDWCYVMNIQSIDDVKNKLDEIRNFCNKYKNYTLSSEDINIVSSSEIEHDRLKVMLKQCKREL